VPGAGCRVPGAGCRVPGAGCRVPGAGCRVPGAGCRRRDRNVALRHLFRPIFVALRRFSREANSESLLESGTYEKDGIWHALCNIKAQGDKRQKRRERKVTSKTEEEILREQSTHRLVTNLQYYEINLTQVNLSDSEVQSMKYTVLLIKSELLDRVRNHERIF